MVTTGALGILWGCTGAWGKFGLKTLPAGAVTVTVPTWVTVGAVCGGGAAAAWGGTWAGAGSCGFFSGSLANGVAPWPTNEACGTGSVGRLRSDWFGLF